MSERIITPSVRAVFFDAVGTLIDPHPPAVEVYQAAGQRHGIALDLPEVARRFHAAFRAEEQVDAATPDAPVNEERERRRWQRIVAEVFAGADAVEALFRELWAYFADPAAWRVNAEAGAVLRRLAAAGLALGVASNFDHRLHALLDGLPELAPLRRRVISSEIGRRKPDPAFFAAVARAAGCSAAAIVFVGDRRDVDYDGARAAGLCPVLFDPGPEPSAGRRRIHRLTELLQ